MSDLAAAQSELQTIFGFDAFRPGQAQIVSAILDGRNVLAVMPTGSGKSLCYQLPALVRDGLTVVVSPLIALMRNQVAQLCANGIAASLNSANDPAENRAILERIGRGELRLVYVAPERLLKSDKEYGRQEWRSIFRQLHGAGIVALDITGHGTWPVTETGRRVLKGAARVTLRQDTLKPATRKAARAAANAAALAGDQGDAALFEALRRRRSELAKEQRVAAYVVFADKTLIDMARRKPATVAEMGAVHGVGAAKLRQYGEVFLDVIRQHAAGRP